MLSVIVVIQEGRKEWKKERKETDFTNVKVIYSVRKVSEKHLRSHEKMTLRSFRTNSSFCIDVRALQLAIRVIS
jgi:hypothetical protein